MIFVDANVPMYLVGGDHSHKADTLRLLRQAATERERLVTDAEVLQEVLHRYVAIKRRDAIHVATMQQHGVTRIMSFDAAFDSVPGLTRIA